MKGSEVNALSKLQAHVSQLNHYKNICEQRIQELAPGHSLPVEVSHLGSEWRPDSGLETINKDLIKTISKLNQKLELKDQTIAKLQRQVQSQARQLQEESVRRLSGLKFQKNETALPEDLQSMLE